jgi:peptide deformylase
MPIQLPDYVVINDESIPKEQRELLRKKSELFHFPLSHTDLQDLKILETKFDQEQNCSGLAAPQIGIRKQAIIFAAPDDPELRKWRPDLSDTMSKTLWLNPTYVGVGDDKHEDYEACFSVGNIAGRVKRFKSISYEAYDVAGKKLTGQISGFLARLVQHEIDHLQGVLFIDIAEKDSLMSIEEYRKMRVAAVARI